MRNILTIGLALAALSFATPAEAREAFTVNVTRAGTDTFQINRTSIVITTKGCAQAAYHQTAVIVINDATGNGKIHFMANDRHEASCTISGVSMKRLGGKQTSIKVPANATINDSAAIASRNAAIAAADVMRALRSI